MTLSDVVVQSFAALSAVVGFVSALVGLVEFKSESAKRKDLEGFLDSHVSDPAKRREIEGHLGRMRLLVVTFAGCASIVLLGSAAFAYFMIPRDGRMIATFLARHDQKLFNGIPAEGEFRLARVFPTRADLESEGRLARVIDETEESFDLLAIGASGVISTFRDHFRIALERNVTVRLLLLDLSDHNKPAVAAYCSASGQALDDLRTKFKLACSHLSKLAGQLTPEARGRLKVRLLSGAHFKCMWLADAKRLRPIGHMSFHSYLDGPTEVSVRFGIGNESLVRELAREFEVLWSSARDHDFAGTK